MILLQTYSCTTTDSIGLLKKKVVEHYTSICDATNCGRRDYKATAVKYLETLLVVYSYYLSSELDFLGRLFDRVDLIKLRVSNVRPYVTPSVCTYVRTLSDHRKFLRFQ